MVSSAANSTLVCKTTALKNKMNQKIQISFHMLKCDLIKLNEKWTQNGHFWAQIVLVRVTLTSTFFHDLIKDFTKEMSVFRAFSSWNEKREETKIIIFDHPFLQNLRQIILQVKRNNSSKIKKGVLNVDRIWTYNSTMRK